MNRSWPAPLGKKRHRDVATFDAAAVLFPASRVSRLSARLRRFPRADREPDTIDSHVPWWMRPSQADLDNPPPEAA